MTSELCDSSSSIAATENEKVCRVCGDNALGHNFNVVTCESCKAFFRRNALKNTDLRCPFSENCEISVVSRRFCQKCRLKKCFQVGMKKEWIWTQGERLQKRRRLSKDETKSSHFEDDVGSVDQSCLSPRENDRGFVQIGNRFQPVSPVDSMDSTSKAHVLRFEEAQLRLLPPGGGRSPNSHKLCHTSSFGHLQNTNTFTCAPRDYPSHSAQQGVIVSQKLPTQVQTPSLFSTDSHPSVAEQVVQLLSGGFSGSASAAFVNNNTPSVLISSNDVLSTHAHAAMVPRDAASQLISSHAVPPSPAINIPPLHHKIPFQLGSAECTKRSALEFAAPLLSSFKTQAEENTQLAHFIAMNMSSSQAHSSLPPHESDVICDTILHGTSFLSAPSQPKMLNNNHVNVPRELLVAVLTHLVRSSGDDSSSFTTTDPTGFALRNSFVNNLNQQGVVVSAAKHNTTAEGFTSSVQSSVGANISGRETASMFEGIKRCTCGGFKTGPLLVDASVNTDAVDIMPTVSSTVSEFNQHQQHHQLCGPAVVTATYSSNNSVNNSFDVLCASASTYLSQQRGIATIGHNNNNGNNLGRSDMDAAASCSADGSDDFIDIEDSLYNMLDAAISSEFFLGVDCGNVGDADSDESLPTTPRFAELTAFEKEKLEELLSANEVMKEPLEKIMADVKHTPTCLMDIIKMLDIGMRRVIKMNKLIAAFRNLCQGDQIALLKGGCIELMILRGVMSYDAEKDSWALNLKLNIKLDILKEVKEKNLYEQHKRFLQSFKPEWRSNERIMLTLSAITLFDPNRPNILHRSLIAESQQMYHRLLRRYLESSAPSAAQKTHDKLISLINELHELHNVVIKILMKINPKDVEPLLIELFDLKGSS